MSIIPPDADTFAVLGPAADLAARIAKTEFVPASLRNKPEATLAAILTGRELGMGPMQALAQINVIEGRPSLSAQAARSLILSRGHELWVEESSITRCVLCARRRGEEHVHRVTWTKDDAVRAHLAGRPNWQSYPRAMLIARATAELARLAFADVLGGMAYVSEELEDGGLEERPAADVPNGSAPETEGRPVRRRARRREGAEPGQLNTAGQATTTTGPPPPSPEPPMPEPPAQPVASEIQVTPAMTLNQQIAMVCKEAGIERAQLVQALTGKTRASEVTREEALQILGQAREIAAGRARLVEEGGNWLVVDVVDEMELGYDGE